jgi:hypothetical protein
VQQGGGKSAVGTKPCGHCGSFQHLINDCPKASQADKKAFFDNYDKGRWDKRGTGGGAAAKTQTAVAQANVAGDGDESTVVSLGSAKNTKAGLIKEYQAFKAWQEFASDSGLDLDDFEGIDACNIGAITGIDLLNPGKAEPARFTLDEHKLYLDSCATYHSAFVDWILSDVRRVDEVLRGNCNAGVTTSTEKGSYGLFEL